MPSDAHRLINALAAAWPGLLAPAVTPDPDALVCGAEGNRARVSRLYRSCQAAYPEAGPVYWSARTWSQLVWQPVFLSVLSVHLSRAVPRLKGFSQSQRAGVVGGFHLASFRAGGHGLSTSPMRAAQLLRAYLRRQYREASAVFSLPPKVADRLAADFLLAALLRAQRSLGLCNSAVQTLAAQWLNAAGLGGCSSLIDVALPDGRAALALGRKICCQHHRRPDGGLCSSCPRLPPERRLALLREELAAAC